MGFLRNYSEPHAGECPSIVRSPTKSVSIEGFGGGFFRLISIRGVRFFD